MTYCDISAKMRSTQQRTTIKQPEANINACSYFSFRGWRGGKPRSSSSAEKQTDIMQILKNKMLRAACRNKQLPQTREEVRGRSVVKVSYLLSCSSLQVIYMQSSKLTRMEQSEFAGMHF